MNHHLFKNFLTSKRVYALNEAYYANLFKRITKSEVHPFYTTQFNNGNKFYDGNPIFSAVSNKRALRIIQEEPETSEPFIQARIGKTPDGNMEELVVSLELSKTTALKLQQLLQYWFVEQMQSAKMEEIIKG